MYLLLEAEGAVMVRYRSQCSVPDATLTISMRFSVAALGSRKRALVSRSVQTPIRHRHVK